MQITPDSKDSFEFISIISQVINRLIEQETPSSLILIKVDNWFGSRWLRFSGKAVNGQLGVWSSTLTILPPFVPSRIVSQRRFIAPLYEETDAGEPIHIRIRTGLALNRRAADVAPSCALVWFNGNSKNTGRGSLMAYIPQDDSYNTWYAAWSHRESWNLVENIGGNRELLQSARFQDA